jgi:hypothetical protein
MSKTVTELGHTYQDILSGFEGVCVGKASYLTGCDQSCLRPKKLNKDGDGSAKGEWFDDTTLVLSPGSKKVVIDSEPIIEAPTARRKGGPNANTPSKR